MKLLLKTQVTKSSGQIFLLAPPPEGEGFSEHPFTPRSRRSPDFISLGQEHVTALSTHNAENISRILNAKVNAPAFRSVLNNPQLSLLPSHVINRVIAEALGFKDVNLSDSDRLILTIALGVDPSEQIKTVLRCVEEDTFMSPHFTAISVAAALDKIASQS